MAVVVVAVVVVVMVVVVVVVVLVSGWVVVVVVVVVGRVRRVHLLDLRWLNVAAGCLRRQTIPQPTYVHFGAKFDAETASVMRLEVVSNKRNINI